MSILSVFYLGSQLYVYPVYLAAESGFTTLCLEMGIVVVILNIKPPGRYKNLAISRNSTKLCISFSLHLYVGLEPYRDIGWLQASLISIYLDKYEIR